jgi:hypothetical protein
VRAGWIAGLVAAALLLSAQPAGAAFGEPVSVTAGAPEVVAAGSPFRVEADVAAEPGALDIAAQPLRVRVRVAPECGGSFAGTEGPTVLDRVLPAPAPGAAYQARVVDKAKLGDTGTETLCAFVEDADERQFATDTEATLTVVGADCLAAKQRIQSLRRRRAKLNRRVARLRKLERHAGGRARQRLQRQLRKLRARRHRLTVRIRRAGQLAKARCDGAATVSAVAAEPPHIDHLFVIVLENENAEETFGPNSPAPYLSETLRAQGAFLPNYYGIGHQSLDNYIAMVSGQPPNFATQSDCQTYTDFAPGTVREDGVALGQGCVYPRTVRTVANQLENSGHSWRGYMQDMGNSVAAGEPASCRHPALGAVDPTQKARANDQYAARHNPFVYFHSIIDYSTCQRNDVDLAQLPGDLAQASTTPEYAFITPDLCADGHDETCADGTSPGGYAGIDAFLREWVPRIQASAAYQDHGAILVTFDESGSGAESCCGEQNGPNTPNNGGPTPGSGGGRVGAVMLSPCVMPGTVTNTAYNHYSFLRWTEDNFGLSHLANAGAEGLSPFGTDVFDKPNCGEAGSGGEGTSAAPSRLKVSPRRALVGRRTLFTFRLAGGTATCRKGATIHFAGRRSKTNRNGRARMKLKLAGHAGRRLAVAMHQGCKPAKVRVRAVKPQA